MRKEALTRWVGWGMVVLAGVQVAGLGFRQISRARGDGVWLASGDTLLVLPVVDLEGHPSSLTVREATVLLVFDPECPHSEEVGAIWADWAREREGRGRVVALSTRRGPETFAFTQRHGLAAEVRALGLARLDGRTALVAGRTPWAFVLDRDGVIVAEGHGARVARLAGTDPQLAEVGW